MKSKLSISITAAFIVSAFGLQGCCCSPLDFRLPSGEDLKVIEWQRNFDGSSEAYHRNDFAEAERMGNAAVKIAEGFKPDDYRLYITLHNLVSVYEDQKKWGEAEQLLMRSLQVAKGNPAKTAEVYNGLAFFYLRQGNVVKFDKMMAAALVAAESGASKGTSNNPEDVERLGRLLQHAKRYAEAEPVLLQALTMQEKRYGTDEMIVSSSLMNLAQMYADEGKPSAAEPLFKRAIVICEKHAPIGNFQRASALNMYGELLEKMKRTAEAKQMFKRAEGLVPQSQR